MVEIETLNKRSILKYMNALIDIDRNILQSYGNRFSSERWEAENFLLDLPGKWELSLVALTKEKVVGFCICSFYNDDKCYAYRVVVAEDHKRKNIGKKMIFSLFEKCKAKKIKNIIVEVNIENVPALQFYNKMGFEIIESDELIRYLIKKGKFNSSCISGNYFAEKGYPENKFVLKKIL